MDVPVILKEFVTVYGPLGLGWPIAFLLFYRLGKERDDRTRLLLQERKEVLDVIRDNTKSITLLAERINRG